MIRSVRPGLEAETVSARTGPWAARSPPLHQIPRFAGKLGNRRRLARPEGRFPLRVHLRVARDCALRWRLHVLVADAVGRALGALGVDVVFGLMGSGNLVVTNALRDAGVPFHASLTLATPWPRRILSAKERRRAKTPGLCRMRLASSPKERSRTWWLRFSIPQCPRTAAAQARASSGTWPA